MCAVCVCYTLWKKRTRRNRFFEMRSPDRKTWGERRRRACWSLLRSLGPHRFSSAASRDAPAAADHCAHDVIQSGRKKNASFSRRSCDLVVFPRKIFEKSARRRRRRSRLRPERCGQFGFYVKFLSDDESLPTKFTILGSPAAASRELDNAVNFKDPHVARKSSELLPKERNSITIYV